MDDNTQHLRLQMFNVFGLSPANSKRKLARAYELLAWQYAPNCATGDTTLFQILNLAYASCEQFLDSGPDRNQLMLRPTVKMTETMICPVCGRATKHISETVSIYLRFYYCEDCRAMQWPSNNSPEPIMTLQNICRRLGLPEPPVLKRVLKCLELRMAEHELDSAQRNAQIRQMVLAERYR
jgi:hypothetical protein